jgi:hypothetical protein
MGVLTHLEMHEEHRYWLSEHALWRDDVSIWEEEARKAVEDLKKVEAALRDHEEALRSHAETLGREEARLRKHEHELAEFEKGTGGTNDLIAMARGHQGEGDRHGELRQAHERIKRYHHTIIAQCALLLKALGKAV